MAERLSYARVQDQAHRLARSLTELGAGPGRHVAILLPNMPEHLIALQGAWLTGATVLQLSPLMVAEEVGRWLEATGCTTVITLDLLAPLVMCSLAKGRLQHVIFTTLRDRVPLLRGWLYRLEHYRRNHSLNIREDAHKHTFDHLLNAAPLAESPPVRSEVDVALVVPTGGTTASSKAVMLTHRNLVANAFQLRELTGGADGTEGVLSVLPFFHAYGLSVCLLGPWVKGATVHLMPRFSTKAALNLIARERIELLALVPAMIAGMNAELKKHPIDLYVRPGRHQRGIGVTAGGAVGIRKPRHPRPDRGVRPVRGEPGDPYQPGRSQESARHHRPAAARYRGENRRCRHRRRAYCQTARWASWWCAGRR